MEPTGNQIASARATGGAGTTFEERVDALFLGMLLLRGFIPVLKDCELDEVRLQTANAGWKTDDMLVVGTTPAGVRRQLAVQVKLSFSVGRGSEDCVATFSGFWHDYRSSRFAVEHDRFALIVQRGTSTLLTHLSSLFDCARAARDAPDFQNRLKDGRGLSKKSHAHAVEIRAILDDAAARPITDDEFLALLRLVHVLSLDLGTATAQTEAVFMTLLRHTATGPDPAATAGATWGKLLGLAAAGMANGSSFARDSFDESLLTAHAPDANDRRALQRLREHAITVLDGIRDQIAGVIRLERATLVDDVNEALEQHRIVLIHGPAGQGKSAIAKRVYGILEQDHYAFAFRAEELARPHLDETLHAAQVGAGVEALFRTLVAETRKVVLIESVERLLESSTRDAFADLVDRAHSDPTLRVILTCRDYSVETVRTSLLAERGVSHTSIHVPALTDAEVGDVVRTLVKLARPVTSALLRTLFRNPFLLDKAAQMEWPEEQALPQDERSFRRKFWRDVVRVDIRAAGGLPQRRETTLIELALRRARELRLNARCDDFDQEALDGLWHDDLVAYSPESRTLAAPAHDVLEDWAILRWIEDRFAQHEHGTSPLANDINGYPALRRGFRRWLGELLACEPTTADAFVFSVLRTSSISPQFRDDTLVSTLTSASAADFLDRASDLLLTNDAELLRRVIHLVRVACKAPPRWVPVDVPSQFLEPNGPAWAAVLRLVQLAIDRLLPQQIGLVLGLIEDFASGVSVWDPRPPGFEDAARIAFKLLAHLQRDGQVQRVLKIIARLPSGDRDQFIALVDRAARSDRKDRVAREFTDIILCGVFSAFVAHDYPDAVIALAESTFYLHDRDILARDVHDFRLRIDPMFGFREHTHRGFFPPSAVRGPFLPLLRSHPEKAVAFIIRLSNHAGTWYGDRHLPGFNLEPASKLTLQVAGHGAVEQWANDRLWRLYRGTSVGPHLLESALMALEQWLLELARAAPDQLDGFLSRLMRDSNNVAITAVVASVCTAFPLCARDASLALLSCRDLFDLDRGRLATDCVGPLALPDIFPTSAEDQLYNDERKRANALPHRREDLERLACRLQLTDARDAVWRLLDHHRSAMPPIDQQCEGDRIWRLHLHRMDLRNFERVPVYAKPAASDSTPGKEAERQVVFAPGPPDPDVQEILDRNTPILAKRQAETELFNWAYSRWERHNQKEQDALSWRVWFTRAQEPAPPEEEPSIFEGRGFVAAVCARDHWDDMTLREREWCVDTLIARADIGGDDQGSWMRSARNPMDPSRAAAYVLPSLLTKLGPSTERDRIVRALAKVLTHAQDEVAAFAAAGVGDYLGNADPAFVQRCIGALAFRAAEVDRRIR